MLTQKVVAVSESHVSLSCHHSYQPNGTEVVGGNYECCNCYSPNYTATGFILDAIRDCEQDYDSTPEEYRAGMDLLNSILEKVS